MAIPVYINQESVGTLSISQEGLYTVFEAEVPGGAGLVRLWAHGDGKSACLGVMEPRDGGLYLRRRLSRRELAAFPDPISFVNDREQNPIHNSVDITQSVEAVSAEEREAADSDAGEEEQAESLHNPLTDYSACPWPAEPPEDGLLWYRRGDGSLVSFDGISSLLAIPAELRAPSARTSERVIEGKKYLVFRY